MEENSRLQETRKNEKDSKEENSKKIRWIFGIIALIIVVVISIIAIQGKEEQNNNLHNKNYISNSSSQNIYYNTNSSNYNDSKSIKHYCDASGCLNEGEYSIKRVGGKTEYYCYKHYKQMEDWAEMIMGY